MRVALLVGLLGIVLAGIGAGAYLLTRETSIAIVVEGTEARVPQRTLARYPAMDVDRGRVSGELDPATTTPSGAPSIPGAVALTFDDGPAEHTRAVLETLRRLAIASLAEVPPKFFRPPDREGGVGDRARDPGPRVRADADRGALDSTRDATKLANRGGRARTSGDCDRGARDAAE